MPRCVRVTDNSRVAFQCIEFQYALSQHVFAMNYGKKKPRKKMTAGGPAKKKPATPMMTYGAATRKARKMMTAGGATPKQVDMIMKMLGKKMYGGAAKKPVMKRGGKSRK